MDETFALIVFEFCRLEFDEEDVSGGVEIGILGVLADARCDIVTLFVTVNEVDSKPDVAGKEDEDVTELSTEVVLLLLTIVAESNCCVKFEVENDVCITAAGEGDLLIKLLNAPGCDCLANNGCKPVGIGDNSFEMTLPGIFLGLLVAVAPSCSA